jgi:YD repeat-containing protein
MVAIVAGSALGLSLGSLATLGQAGATGSAASSRNRELAFVNAATGNLILQDADERVVARGQVFGGVRTYNSQGQFTDDNGDNWSPALSRRIVGSSGAIGAASSTVTREDDDGARSVFTWNSSATRYESTDGAGGVDSIVFNSSTATWDFTDGASQNREKYAFTGGRLASLIDPSGNTTSLSYTDALLTQVAMASGDTIFYEYNSGTQQLARIRTQLQNGTTYSRISYSYDTSNRLEYARVDLTPSVTSDTSTYWTRYEYDGASKPVGKITQSDGTSITIAYRADFKVDKVTDGLGRFTSFAYDAVTRRTSVTDELARTTIFEYDTARRLKKVTAPQANGVAQTTTYDVNNATGDVERITDGLGRSIEMSYDTAGNQTLQRDSAGNTVARTFDSGNRLKTETAYAVADPDGSGALQPTQPLTTRYVYDAAGRLRFVLTPQGRVTQFVYNATGDRISELVYQSDVFDTSPYSTTQTPSVPTVPTENVIANWATARAVSTIKRTDMAYDLRGQLQRQTSYLNLNSAGAGLLDGTESVTQYVYDASGTLIETINPLLGKTIYVTDGLGRVITTIEPHQTISTLYDDANNKTVVSRANGLLTTSAYDKAGRLLSVSQAASGAALSQTQYVRDAAGQLRMVIDGTGAKTYFLYDAAGRKVADIDSDGSLVESVYNAAGQQTQSIRYAIAVNVAGFEASGVPTNVTLAAIRPAGYQYTTKWNLYDRAGRLAKMVDEEGAVTETRYDGASRVIEVVEYANRVGSANFTAATVPTDAVATPYSDGYDRRTRHFYDADGQRIATLDAEGYLKEFTYDAAGQLRKTFAYATKQADAALRATGALNALRPGLNALDDITSWSFYNTKGQRIATVDGVGQVVEYGFDASGNTVSERRFHDLSRVAINDVGLSTSLASVRPVNHLKDRVSISQYTAGNRLNRTVDAEGTVTQYGYDAVGNLTSTVRAQGQGATEARTATRRFDALGRLTSELNGEGSAALAALGATPTAAQTDAVWAAWSNKYAYDAADRKTSSTNALGHKTLYFYSADGRLTHTISPTGQVQENRYNALNQLVTTVAYAKPLPPTALATLVGGLATPALTTAIAAIADAAYDVKNSFTYTARDQVETQSNADGVETVFNTYSAFREMFAVREKVDSTRTNLTYIERDRKGMVTVETKDALATSATSVLYRDAFGRAWRTLDAKGNLIESKFDRSGRVVKTTDPLNVVREATYDAFDRKLKQQDGAGLWTEYIYDDVARTVTVKDPLGITVTTGRNRHGQTVSITDDNNTVTSFEYDRNGNLKKSKLDASQPAQETVTYDKAGLVYEKTDANGVVTRFEYDASARLLKRTVDARSLMLLTQTEYLFDKGAVVRETDANGVVRDTRFDRNGRVASLTVDPAALRLVTTFTYDPQGRQLRVTDANGVVTEYKYDNLGRRIEETVDAGTAPGNLNLKTQYAYDKLGNVTRRIDAKLQHTRYIYDANNRLSHELDAESGLTQYAYDKDGRVVSKTRYAQVQGGIRTSEPVPGLVTNSFDFIASNPAKDQVTRYVYDAAGRLTHTASPTGAVVGLQYDKAGRVVTRTEFATPISDAALPSAVVASPTNDRVTRTVYDSVGRARYTADAEGGVTEMRYDAAGNLVWRKAYAGAINLSSLTGAATATDFTSRLVAQEDNDRTTSYFYDGANRLGFEVDALGNVTETQYLAKAAGVAAAVQTTRYAYWPYVSSAGLTFGFIQMTLQDYANPDFDAVSLQRLDAAGRVFESVDAMGAVTRREFDGQGRVLKEHVAVDRPEVTATEFVYDAAGRTLSKTIAAGTEAAATVSYTYDAVGQVQTETEARGNALAARNPASDSAWAKQERVSRGYNELQVNLTEAERQALKDLYTTRFEYDKAGRQTKATNALGANTDTVFDIFGNAVKVIDALGHAGFFYFDKLNRLVLSVDPERYATETQYTGTFADKAASVRRYSNRVTGAYDQAARPTLTRDDVKDAISSTTYDRLGRTTGTKDAAGATETLVYNVDNNRFDKRVTNKVGGVATLHIDKLGRQARETLPVTAKVTLGDPKPVVNYSLFDAFGNRFLLFEADGLSERRVTEFRFDKANRVTHRIGEAYEAFNAATGTTTTVKPVEITRYDSLGRVIELIDGAHWDEATSTATGGTRTLSCYNAAGAVVRKVAADGATTSYTYSPTGKVWRETASAKPVALPAAAGGTPPAAQIDTANDRVTTHFYDQADRLSEVRRDTVVFWEQPQGTNTVALTVSGPETLTLKKLGYDAVGNLVQETDARGNSSFNYFDRTGRRTLRIDAEGYATAWNYGDIFDVATREVRYSTRLAEFARQDDSAKALALRDPALLLASLASNGVRTIDGTKAVRLTYTEGTQSDINRALGDFVAGDTVTVSVWFKADAQTSGMVAVGDTPAAAAQAKVMDYGDSGWKRLTLSVVVNQNKPLRVFLYGDKDGGFRQAGNSVVYDLLTVSSTQKGTVLAEGFEAGLTNWADGGGKPTLETVALEPDRITTTQLDRAGRVKERAVLHVVSAQVSVTGEVTQRAVADSAITAYDYDGLGNVTRQRERVEVLADGVSSLWNVTDIAYDKLGREIKRQSPGFTGYEGTTVRPTQEQEYNSLGNVARSIQRGTNYSVETDDRITQYGYDINGKQISVTDPTLSVTQYTLDAAGRIARSTVLNVKDANSLNGPGRSVVKHFEYDVMGRVVKTTDVGTGETRITAYNAFGEVSKKGLGTSWHEFAEYDTRGLLQKGNSGDGVTKIYLYDKNGNTTRKINPSNSTTTDLQNQAVKVSSAASDVTLWHTFSVYDKRNQLIKTVEPDISFARGQVSLSQSFSQALVEPYGAIGAVTTSGGTYGQGTSSSTSQTTTVAAVTGASASMLPPARGSAPTVAFSLGNSNSPVQGNPSSTLSLLANWAASDIINGDQPQLTFPLPSSFPAGNGYEYRMLYPFSSFSVPISHSMPFVVNSNDLKLQIKLGVSSQWVTIGAIYFDSTVYRYESGAESHVNGAFVQDKGFLVPIPSGPFANIKAFRNVGTATQSEISFAPLLDFQGVPVIGWNTLNLSGQSYPPGQYTIQLRSFDPNSLGGVAEDLLIDISTDQKISLISRTQVNRSDVWVEKSPDGSYSLRFGGTLAGQMDATKFYARPVGTNENWLDWSDWAASPGPTVRISGKNFTANTTYEFLVGAGGAERYGTFSLDPTKVPVMGNSGMLTGVTRPEQLLSFDFAGKISDSSAGLFEVEFIVEGVRLAPRRIGQNANWTSNISFIGASSDLASLGISPYSTRSFNYSYRLVGLRPNNARQFIGAGSGTVSLGKDFSISASTNSFQPFAQMALTGVADLSGSLKVSALDSPSYVVTIAPGDWRRSVVNNNLRLELSEWISTIGRTIQVTYDGSESKFTNTYQLAPSGQVTASSQSQSFTYGHKVTLNIPNATQISEWTVKNPQNETVNISETFQGTGPQFTWDAKEFINKGTHTFSYQAKDPLGNIVAWAGGDFTVSDSNGIRFNTTVTRYSSSLININPPAGTTYFGVRIGNDSAGPFGPEVEVRAPTWALDVTSFRGSNAVTKALQFTAKDATGKVISAGTGTFTVNPNGSVTNAQLAAGNAPGPSTFTFEGPPGKQALGWMRVQHRAKALPGATPASFTSVNVKGTWDSDRSRMQYVWTLPVRTAAVPEVFEYELLMLNNNETTYLNEIGDPVEMKGEMTLGASANTPVQFKQYRTELQQSAQVRRFQSYNAFGEVSEEFDDTTWQRAQAMQTLAGAPAGAADMAGIKTTFVYNALGRLISKTDPQTHTTAQNGFRYRERPVTSYGYDLTGRLVSSKDANGNTSRQTYAGEGDRVAKTWNGNDETKTTQYDVFGNLRKTTNALNRVTEQDTDAMGRVTTIRRLGVTRAQNFTAAEQLAGAGATVGTTLTESFAYDGLGQRISATNALGGVSKTFYDNLGRVTQTVTAQGLVTNYTYAFVPESAPGAAVGAGNKKSSGWQLTTTGPDGRATVDLSDYFGRQTTHKDQGNRSYVYAYNVGGQLVQQTSTATQAGTAGQNISYQYYANGYLKQSIDTGAFGGPTSGNVALNTIAQYGYDSAGNRVWEAYSPLDPVSGGPQGVYQNAVITYDELNRIARVSAANTFDLRYEYDAVGNRRMARAVYWNPLTRETTGLDEFWYAYDKANRFTITKGSLFGVRGSSRTDTSGSISLGRQGVGIGYDAVGQRVSAQYVDPTNGVGRPLETYTYTTDGYLEDFSEGGVIKTRRRLDALGRTREYIDIGSPAKTTTTSYDLDNRVLTSETNGAKTSYFYFNDLADTDSSATGGGTGALARTENRATAGATPVVTRYTYQYWDGAKQTAIRLDAGWAPGQSSLSYNVNGHLAESKDLVGGLTRTYFNNANGLVLRRTDTKGANTYHTNWFYAAGRRVGDVSTNPDYKTQRISYAEALAQGKDTDPERFKNLAPVTSSDFDQNYEPISPSYPPATGSAYTVRAGDTLAGVAQALWGDRAMWYLIAEANGMSGRETLTAGQTLVIPNKVTNIHNNSETFRPYNPGEVIGRIDPTLPPAPPPPAAAKGGCGTIGMVLMIVVAVVVTIYTAGAAATYFAGMAAGGAGGAAAVSAAAASGTLFSAGVAALGGGSIAGAVVGGMAGSIASQLVGKATGNVDKFSWKQVAWSGIGAGITAGVGAGLNSAATAATNSGWSTTAGVLKAGTYTRAAIQGALGSAGYQLARKDHGGGAFSWREVAASAVGAAAGQAASVAVGSVAGTALGSMSGFAQNLAAGMASNWASNEVRARDPNYRRAPAGAAFISSLGSALGNALVEGLAPSQAGAENRTLLNRANQAADADYYGSGTASSPVPSRDWFAGTGLRLGDGGGGPRFGGYLSEPSLENSEYDDSAARKRGPDADTRDATAQNAAIREKAAARSAADARKYAQYMSGRPQSGAGSGLSVIDGSGLSLTGGPSFSSLSARSSGTVIPNSSNSPGFYGYVAGAAEMLAGGFVNQLVRAGAGVASLPPLLLGGVDAAVAVQDEVNAKLQYSLRTEGAQAIAAKLAPVFGFVKSNVVEPSRNFSERYLGDGMTTVLGASLQAGFEIYGTAAGIRATGGFASAAWDSASFGPSSGGRTAQLGGVNLASPRNQPGVVTTGDGLAPASGTWLSAATPSPIPLQVAQALEGRSFNTFKDLQSAVWRTIANDTDLSAGFGQASLGNMFRGNAPFVPPAYDNLKFGDRFNLHHIKYIENGGAVYDLSNLLIVSPRHHFDIHHPPKS